MVVKIKYTKPDGTPDDSLLMTHHPSFYSSLWFDFNYGPISSHDAMKVMKFFREILTRKFLSENLRKYYTDEKF